MNLFIISDIHGMYQQFEQLIKKWDMESKFVILGDMVDRGPQSLHVIRKVMDLKRTYGQQVIVCKGNHEEMFLNYLSSPEANKEFYFRNGGRQTMDSFLDQLPSEMKTLNFTEQASIIKERFKEETSFLAEAELFVIVGDVLLTHAGFETQYDNLDKSTEDDFLWTRDHYLKENQTPYVNVFGHTPLKYIHEKDDVWMSENGKFIGIDGGCCYGGQLNALFISDKGEVLNTFYEKSSNT
ncbi:metallophosphoesterase family protein [Solibacillus sp. FSL K6-1523]|uniref:metallophosphoesterase family protein n=1 Tax=Solibacillus sp. FSL K6-1523 TaxID=2921471 RepID=UPI0030F4DACF